MEAKLVKRSNSRFDLYTIEDINQINTIASSFDNPKGKLSIKNCQVIESGYDLDELAEKNTSDCDASGCYPEDVFKKGFKKALEIRADKKYSEEDVLKELNKLNTMPNSTLDTFTDDDEMVTMKWFEQSRQQTEWVVEVVMDPTPLTFMGRNLGRNIGILPDLKPKLDADGCLILKRI